MLRKLNILFCLFAIGLAVTSCNKDEKGEAGGDGKLGIKVVNNTAKTVSRLTIKDAASNGFDIASPPYLYDAAIEMLPSGSLNFDFEELGIFKGSPYDGNYVFVILATFTDATTTGNLIHSVPTIVNIRLECRLDP